MAATTDSRNNSSVGGGSDRVLHIAHIRAARDQARPARGHAVPNHSGFFVAVVARTQQITVEPPVERRVSLFAGIGHCVVSLVKFLYTPQTRQGLRSWYPILFEI